MQSSKLSSQAGGDEKGIIFSWLDLHAADNIHYLYSFLMTPFDENFSCRKDHRSNKAF